MPLIQCPACQKEVSDAAALCIFCGHPIASEPAMLCESNASAPDHLVEAFEEYCKLPEMRKFLEEMPYARPFLFKAFCEDWENKQRPIVAKLGKAFLQLGNSFFGLVSIVIVLWLISVVVRVILGR